MTNETLSLKGMRTYMCQTLTKEGIRCGKYAEYKTEADQWICQACWWKYKRATGNKIVDSNANLHLKVNKMVPLYHYGDPAPPKINSEIIKKWRSGRSIVSLSHEYHIDRSNVWHIIHDLKYPKA